MKGSHRGVHLIYIANYQISAVVLGPGTIEAVVAINEANVHTRVGWVWSHRIGRSYEPPVGNTDVAIRLQEFRAIKPHRVAAICRGNYLDAVVHPARRVNDSVISRHRIPRSDRIEFVVHYRRD